MTSLDGKDLLSANQVGYLCDIVDKIIEDLPGRALNQLLEGYSNDVDRMLQEMLCQSERALYLGRTLDSESLDYIENVKASMDTTLKIQSLNYFIVSMLPSFRMGWRNIEWGNLIQLFPWSCYLCGRGSGKSYTFSYAFVLWRLWSYCRPTLWIPNTIDNQNRKETCYITSTMTLAKVQIAKVREEIETNDLIKEKLNPMVRQVSVKQGSRQKQVQYFMFEVKMVLFAVFTLELVYVTTCLTNLRYIQMSRERRSKN